MDNVYSIKCTCSLDHINRTFCNDEEDFLVFIENSMLDGRSSMQFIYKMMELNVFPFHFSIIQSINVNPVKPMSIIKVEMIHTPFISFQR